MANNLTVGGRANVAQAETIALRSTGRVQQLCKVHGLPQEGTGAAGGEVPGIKAKNAHFFHSIAINYSLRVREMIQCVYAHLCPGKAIEEILPLAVRWSSLLDVAATES
eukprot:scaffold2858_cov659-Pavlova_lutheri.AAC.223